MYHSITFGSKNTWDDWHIVPSSQPVFDPPKVKTKTMDIPGRNGLLDLSESLTGYPVFTNREGSFEFIVLDGYNKWNELYSDISDYLHGKVMRAVLEDDPEYYYEGRFSVNSWKSDKSNSKITINYSVLPYKRKTEQPEMSMNATIGGISKTIRNSFYGREPVCPHITVRIPNGMTHILFTNNTLGISRRENFSDGEYDLPEIIFYGESVRMEMSVDDTAAPLYDSNDHAICDSSNNPIMATNNAIVTISCKYGRL